MTLTIATTIRMDDVLAVAISQITLCIVKHSFDGFDGTIQGRVQDLRRGAGIGACKFKPPQIPSRPLPYWQKQVDIARLATRFY